MTSDPVNKEIVYIGDPMCSWCYGFSPVIQHLNNKHKHEVKMTLVVGGLHVGDNCITDEKRAEFLRHHWEEISDRSGQPFSYKSLENLGWLYDTEPACRSVVAVRKLEPEKAFPYFATVQSGFYADAKDTNADDIYVEAAEQHGIDGAEFLKTFHDEATKQETFQDFNWSRSMGVTGYPTVLVRDGEDWAALTFGYQPLEALEGPLEGWVRAGSTSGEPAVPN